MEWFMRWFLISGVHDGGIVFRVLIVPDPKLKTQFLPPIAQRDLINPGLVAGPKFEMNCPVRADGQVFRGGDNLTAIESVHRDRLSGIRSRILHGNIHRLIVPQSHALEGAVPGIGCNHDASSHVDTRRGIGRNVS
jgi:hypothetical protein